MKKELNNEIQSEGKFKLKVYSAEVIVHRFKPDEGYEVKITAVDEDMDYASVYLSISKRIIQSGKLQGKVEAELTFEMLSKLGVPNNGMALDKLDTLIGKTVNFASKINDAGYMNWYLNVYSETKITGDKLKNIMNMFAPNTKGKAMSQNPNVVEPDYDEPPF